MRWFVGAYLGMRAVLHTSQMLAWVNISRAKLGHRRFTSQQQYSLCLHPFCDLT